MAKKKKKTLTSREELGEQSTIFMDTGGKALTAGLRTILLFIAVVFQGIAAIFIYADGFLKHQMKPMDKLTIESETDNIKKPFLSRVGLGGILLPDPNTRRLTDESSTIKESR